MKKDRYYCTNCRKHIENLEKLLFIDDYSLRGFCSEECILEFYSPYIDSFYAQEAQMRKDLKLAEQGLAAPEIEKKIFSELIESPHEIWMERNDLGEVFFTHISFFDDYGLYAAMICAQYEGEVSFIFHKCITRSESLINCYRRAQKVQTSKTVGELESEVVSGEDDVELPAELMEELEQKKSHQLANLLQLRKDEDIDYGEFMDYEAFLPQTLEDPDEVYESMDDEGDEISTFIKSFQYHKGAFFYVVLCWRCEVKSMNEQMLIPILAFPSTDQQLYAEFAIGERVVGQLKS